MINSVKEERGLKMDPLFLSYMLPTGGFRSHRFTNKAEMLKKLKSLKRKATLRDEDWIVVGGVEDWADRVDDRRLRWVWWYEG